MQSRPASVVVADGLAALVEQHRAETAAKLEGRIEPVVPAAAYDDGDGPAGRRRGPFSVRHSTGDRDLRRESRRDSRRQSFMSQHFAMSAATTGCGQGLGWSLTNLEAIQPGNPPLAQQGMFGEDGIDQADDRFFVKPPPRKSRFRYSMIDPSLGLGLSGNHDDETTYSERAGHIRAMIESGNTEIERLSITGDTPTDPDFQSALQAAMESFPPGLAAQIVEEASLHERAAERDETPPTTPASPDSRYSIKFASKTAWRDIRSASNRLSRVGSKTSSYIKPYEKVGFTRRLWSRISLGRSYVHITS